MWFCVLVYYQSPRTVMNRGFLAVRTIYAGELLHLSLVLLGSFALLTFIARSLDRCGSAQFAPPSRARSAARTGMRHWLAFAICRLALRSALLTDWLYFLRANPIADMKRVFSKSLL